MIKQIALTMLAVCSWGLMHVQAQKNEAFRPKEVWNDTEGNPINAHGGGILYHDGTYYWYGEYKVGETVLPADATWERYRTDVTGVSCYSSRDLLNWKFEGVALKAIKDDPESDIHPSQVLERPKVIYNKKTKKFVMWMHIDSPDYSKAESGVAIADSPTGPFTYLDGFRPNGSMARDQTLFVDDDGTAYQFASSEENQTMHINRKHNGKYYMLSSGCTGWDPNRAELAVADSIMGEWTVIGDPCTGPDADKTFYGQSTYVIPVQGKKNAYIACFDMWKKKDLQDSRYIWLPMIWNEDKATFSIPWHAEWKISEIDWK